MNLARFSPNLLIAVSLLAACKKDVEVPDSLSPADFYVTGTLVKDTGEAIAYAFRGGDPAYPFSGSSLDLTYESDAYIMDSLWFIWGGLGYGYVLPRPIFIQISHPNPVTDPFASPEWRKADVETVLYPGKAFTFGGGPGQAIIGLSDVGMEGRHCNTLNADNAGNYLRVLEVEDYGAPEIGVPYFGKRIRFALSCRLTHPDGKVWRLEDAEAVLYFRYDPN